MTSAATRSARPSWLLALALAAALTSPAVGQIPDDALELLVDVRIENGPTSLMLARELEGTTLLAVQQVLALAEVRLGRAVPGSMLEFLLEPAGVTVTILTDSMVVLRDGEPTAIPPRGAHWEDDLLFLDADLLADLLGGRATTNIPELSVVIWQADVPVVRRLARERRRSLLAQPTPEEEEAYWGIASSPALLGGAVLDWNVGATTTAQADSALRMDNGFAQLTLGVDVLGGNGVVQHDRAWYRGVDGSAHNTYASWVRAWPTNPWLRQVRLGDVLGTGPRPRFARGFALTNVPFVRPSDFSLAEFTGMLEPGWDIELYRGGVLVDAGRSGPGGRYAFSMPIRYGSNPVEIVAYGPHGEVQRFQRTFEVPFERLTAGLVEYGVSAALCRDAACSGTGNADLRWGATRQLTLRAGADYYWGDTLPNRGYPYAGAVFQATRSLALSADAILNAEFGGRMSLAPSPDFQLTAGHRRLVADSADRVAGLGISGDQTDAYVFYRPGLMDDRVFLRVGGARFSDDSRTTYRAQATASIQVQLGRFDIGTIVTRNTNLPGLADSSANSTVTLLRLGGVLTPGTVWSPLHQMVLRADLTWEKGEGLDLASAALSRRFARHFYLEGGGGWDRFRGGFLELAFRADLAAGRFSTQNLLDGEEARGLQRGEGSLLFGRQGRPVSFANGRSVGRSGVAGTVFLDLDGDGVYDAGEPPVPGARLRVGPWYVVADELGTFATWDVVPFEALEITVDPTSGTDAQWTPSATRFVVRPDPNRFQRVDIPFVQTAEAMGEVRLLPANTPVAGITVVLEPEDGSEPYTARTFSDGVFYLMGIRPGVYRVTVPPAQREMFRLDVEDVLIEVVAGETTVVEGVVLWATRRSE